MAAPAVVKLVEPRTNINRVGLAVRTGDGNIQDLDTFEGNPIEDGSTLRVCATDWTSVKEVHERIADTWSLITVLN